MLKFLRSKKIQKRLYILLAIVIVPPFVAWGVISDKDNKSIVLGTVDGKRISVQDYLDSYHAVEHQALMMYGNRLDEIRQQINFKGEAWDRFLILDYARKNHIKASDDEVVDWLQSQEVFNQGGRFDLEFYKRFVEDHLHENTRDFENEIRGMLTIHKVRDKLAGGVSVSDGDLKALYAETMAGRDLAFGLLPLDRFKENVSVQDKELESLFPLIGDKLTAPARVNVRYVFIPKEGEVSRANALADKDASIDAISQKYGLTPKETGFFSQNDKVPAFEGAPPVFKALSLPVKQTSPWIRTDKGAYKIEVIDRQAERPLSHEEALVEMRRVLTNDKARDAAKKKMNELKKKMAAAGFEKVLADEKIDVKTVDSFKSSDTVAGIAGPQVAAALKGLKEGGISEPVDTPDGVAIFKVVKDHPVDEKKFQADKEKFREQVLDQKINAQFETLVEGLRKDLKINMDTMRKVLGQN